MNSFIREVRETLFPRGDTQHGPLPPLLIGMTVVTGLIDAFSYLVLGHVFVANMTGNVVFLAFALAGAPGFSIAASLLALVSFSIGALGGGLLGSRLGRHRGHLLAGTASIQTLFLGTSVVLGMFSKSPVTGGYLYGLIIVLGISMGLQNATARKLAVPDLTTTVLTLTIVGIGADHRIVGGTGSRAGRRSISVAAMFLGALVGALLIFYASIVYPLVIALVLIAVVAVVAQIFSSKNPRVVQTST